MMHLMAISWLEMNLYLYAFLVFRLSWGSVVTLIRWGGWNSHHHMCHSFLNLTVKNIIKIRWFLMKSQTKISWLLFMAHGVVMSKLKKKQNMTLCKIKNPKFTEKLCHSWLSLKYQLWYKPIFELLLCKCMKYNVVFLITAFTHCTNCYYRQHCEQSKPAGI